MLSCVELQKWTSLIKYWNRKCKYLKLFVVVGVHKNYCRVGYDVEKCGRSSRLRPENRKQPSPKCLCIYTRLYGAKSQKTSFNIYIVESKIFIKLPFITTFPNYW